MLYVSVNLFFSREQTFKKLVILVFSLIYKPSPLCADYHIPILVKFDFLYILMQTRGSVMKKIILISLFGLMFSTGGLETRTYDLGTFNFTEGEEYLLDLYSITGYDLDFAYITFGKVENFSFCCNTMDIHLRSAFTDYDGDTQYRHHSIELMEGGGVNYNPPQGYSVYTENNPVYLRFWNGNGSASVSISITAEFPIEDTGYIEEGFDFCLVSGNNLVAFPCDNPVSVETALPELAQAEIQQIIGSGVASTNVNGQFLGSLQNFTPGAGYWFKSSSSMCFNYTCTE